MQKMFMVTRLSKRLFYKFIKFLKKFFYISIFSGRKRFSTFTIISQDIIFFPGLFITYVFPSLNEGSRQKTFGPFAACEPLFTLSAMGAFIALLGVH